MGSAVMLNPVGDHIPGYTRLQWIESTGTQYITTGCHTDAEFSIEIDGWFKGGVAGYNRDFGLRDAAGVPNSQFLASMAGDFSVGTGGAGIRWFNIGSGSDTGVEVLIGTRIRYRIDKSSWTNLDTGHKVTAYSTPPTVSYNPNELLFFAGTNAIGGPEANAFFRAYDVKIYSAESPVAHLVPVRKNADGEIGMYDTIMQIFRPNLGTGQFISGPPI